MLEPIQNVNYEELNKQLNTLSDVVKTLQGQISKIQDFMSELSNKKVDNKNQCKDSIKAPEPEKSVIMMPDTEVGAESIYNLFNEKEPPVFPGTLSYNAAAASNSEHNEIKTVGKKQNKHKQE